MLAAPLAEQFGVPGSAVTSLLESGVSLESVTQLLLVKQSTDKSLNEVTDLYRNRKAADQLGVAADRYSKEKVESAIERARADATEKASETASDAAGKAVGGLLGAP
jgi:ribosomal protein L12E/L44/L45/RPP1/RPP2